MSEPVRNPYPGLRPFRTDEKHLFFGREQHVDRMVEKLAARHFLAVVGGSGSGKSSLVNCGLRPALHRGNMASAGASWRMAQMRPGSDPIGSLARALAAPGVLFDKPMTGALSGKALVESTLRLGSLGLIDMVEQADLPSGTQLLVVADQFEELFRFRSVVPGAHPDGFSDTEDAVAFVRLLLEAAAQTEVPIYVVLTMRSDFLEDCARFQGLPEAINESQYLVPRLTRNEIRAAITGPAAVRGATLSPVLVTRLLNDVGDNPDQLSILQHALNRTWYEWEKTKQPGSALDLAHYEAAGGMAKALNQHADRAYGELTTPRQKQICEKLFKALTDKATDPRGTRRPIRLDTLRDLADATAAEVTEVIKVFRKASRSFLMPPEGEALEAGTVIDISHESLMRVWQKLNGWADDEAQSAQTYRRLAEAAAAKTKEGLLSQLQVDVNLAWRKRQSPNKAWARRYGGEFVQAMDFLDDSNAVAVIYAAGRGRRRRRIAAAAFAGVLLLLTGSLGWVASDIERAGSLDGEARRLQENLNFIAGMRRAYLERTKSEAEGATPKQCQQSRRDRVVKWRQTMFDQVCLGKGDETERAELGLRLEVLDMINDGNIDDAYEKMAKLQGQSAMIALLILQRVADMQPKGMRSELRRLVKSNGQTLGDAPSGASSKPSHCDSPQHGENSRFVHPIHRGIAAALCGDGNLTENARRLVATYQSQVASEQRLVEQSKRLLAQAGSDALRNQRDSRSQQSQVKPFELEGDEALPRPSNVEWVYRRVARNASQPESKLAALRGEVADLMRTYRWEMLAMLLPFIWWPWRAWRRHRGATFRTRPSALRRASATLMDCGICVGLFVLLAVMTEQTRLTMGLTTGFAESALVIVGSLSALSYLLFCDATRFKYCRSIGKVLFDLRPIRDTAEDRGAIGLSASAKRNLPFIIALLFAPLLLLPPYLLLSVLITLMFAIFPQGLELLSGLVRTMSPGFIIFALLTCSLVLLWAFYAFESVRKVSDRWFGARWSKWLFRPLLGVLFPPSWFLFEGSRTVGDRWSRTQVIDADSEESLRIDAPPRYIHPDPDQARHVVPTTS